MFSYRHYLLCVDDEMGRRAVQPIHLTEGVVGLLHGLILSLLLPKVLSLHSHRTVRQTHGVF